MLDNEALHEIEQWFKSLEEAKRKSEQLAKLQQLAKTHPEDALLKLRQLDQQPRPSGRGLVSSKG